MYNEPEENNEYGQQSSYSPPPSPPPHYQDYNRYGYDPRYRMPAPPQKRSKLPLFLGLLFGFVVGAVCLFVAMFAFNGWSMFDYGDRIVHNSPPPPTQNAVSPTPRAELGGGNEKLEIVPVIPVTPSPQYDAQGRELLSNAQIYEKGQPSVVCILVEDSATRMIGSGSGIIMSAEGYIITNYHVVEGATNIQAVLYDKSRYTARIVGTDQLSDLAVIKIDAEELVPAEFGDSNALSVGDPILVIGNPLGLELQSTATQGMVSAINRDIEIDSRIMTTIQTDASVNQGNSGGPMFNQFGQVVGIISSKIMSTYTGSVEGLGFAIPISGAKAIIDDLIKNGYVTGRPTIGITNYDVITAYTSRYFGLPQGVRVLGISEQCDAYKQGLRVNDLIIAVNDITIVDGDELNGIKNEYTAGDKLTLTVYRDGRTIDITFELMEAGTLNG